MNAPTVNQHSNQHFAESILRCLVNLGVREIVLCPGARNAPFVELLDCVTGITVYPFFEERSAGFFALGLIKRHGRPVAVCTTSGTAAAELFPAVIEGHYSGLPLIALTCDRPRRLRGSGAPQSIDQLGLYGTYVSSCFDLDSESELEAISEKFKTRIQFPLHFNICLDEPLSSSDTNRIVLQEVSQPAFLNTQNEIRDGKEKIQQFLSRVQSPLVVLGPLESAERRPVADWLRELGAPILSEVASGLRGASALANLELRAGNWSAGQLLLQGSCDSVLRIGGVPTCRLWRDLDEKLTQIPVLSVSRVPYMGLARGELLTVAPAQLFDDLQVSARFTTPDLASDRNYGAALDELLVREPTSEPGMFRCLSRWVGPKDRIYLGNSLPIREWDLAADRGVTPSEIGVNRGTNGIDGQLSTFFGFCDPELMNWAILGDLTTLYDLSGPWAATLRPECSFRLIVINNSGGQIFNRMFRTPLFRNQHTLEFIHWAAMWGLDYHRYTAIPPHPPSVTRCIVEVVPDSVATTRFWDGLAVLAT